MKSVLALDLGTTFGWAILRPDNRIEHGFESLALKKHEHEGARFTKFYRWLLDTNQAADIGQVYFENLVFSMPNAALAGQIHGGLRAVMLMFCERHLITFEGFGPSTVKKRFAGHGNATKQDMVKQCQALGFHVTDDNEADAIAILHVGTDRCPILTMSGATRKGPRAPKPQPELRPGQDPF